MTTEQQPPAEASATGDAANLHKDPETGEMISKSELKRREKQRAAAKKKAEKAASLPVQTKKADKGPSENDLNPNQYFEIRTRRIDALRESREPNPYPHKFHVNTSVPDFLAKYEHLKNGEELRDVEVTTAVRIMTIRTAGNHLRFYNCKSEGVSLQIFCEDKNMAEGAIAQHDDLFRRGDWVGVTGFPGRTTPKNRDIGELSIFAKDVKLLSPCLHQLPHGIKDQETRFRQRYLDLILNNTARETLLTRSKIIRYIRNFFEARGFHEFETPTLNKIHGGATARPFKTFHNDMSMDMFMRVAPELYLKMLIVGGMDKVFEIGKQFRNEDIDLTHNPEFTSAEFYWAFADYFDLMDLTEELVSEMVKEITGSYETELHMTNEKIYKINWARPWKRVQMIPTLEEKTGEKFPAATELHSDETNVFLDKVLKKMNIECSEPRTNSRMIDKLVGDLIEVDCVNPTFICGHPQVMSPLAKPDRNTPGLCERFEMFTATKELVNAYTELNDPKVQRQLFEQQALDAAKGDDEAQPIDETFLQALEYGLPPTGGWGLGIDRLVMFLTNKYNIKEVLAFPLMKPITENKTVEIEGEKVEQTVAPKA